MARIDTRPDTEIEDATAYPVIESPAELGPVRDFSTLIAAGEVTLAPRMMDTKDKEELAALGDEFVLLALGSGEDETGSYWAHLIEWSGVRCTFRLNHHPARNRTAMQLQGALQAGPIAGMTLKSLSERMGNQFLVLWPVEPSAEGS